VKSSRELKQESRAEREDASREGSRASFVSRSDWNLK
jgi:hypothetical protein